MPYEFSWEPLGVVLRFSGVVSDEDLIASGQHIRGMSNMYRLTHEARGGSWTTEIFEREEDARAWAVPSS